jgi:chemotaxis protein histidine kinase CheA
MNKSLLLVVCDFLLLSLLGFVQFDVPEDASAKVESFEEAAAASKPEDDLIEALKLSLEEEQKAKTELASDVSQSEEEINRKAEELRQKEEALKKLAQEQKELLENQEKIKQQLALTEKEKLEREEALQKTEKTLELAMKTADELVKENQDIQSEKRRLEELKQQIERKADLVESELSKTIEDKEKINQTLSEIELAKKREFERNQLIQSELNEKEQEAQRLRIQLESSEREKAQISEALALARDQVKVEREERQILHKQTERLTEEVTDLVSNTTEIRNEVKELQTLTVNEIYQRYDSNKVALSLNFTIGGIFGTKQVQQNWDSIILKHNELLFTVFNTVNSPLEPDGYTDSILNITGEIIAGGVKTTITRIGFLSDDSRIAIIPISSRFIEASKITSFPISIKPFGHASASLINTDKDQFGETTFKLNPSLPQYLKMDSKVLSKLFGDFAPTSGDMVFTLKGEFLGIMSNSDYALKIRDLNVEDSINLSERFSPEEFMNTHKKRIQQVVELPKDFQ